jgi:5-methylcytosine-specific restriction endonuclease McrA
MPSAPRKHGAEQVAARRRQYDRQRRPDHDFYTSPMWRAVRSAVLMRDPICVICRDEQNRIVSSTVVDHIKERRDYPELALDMDNLRGLCASCHNRRTRQREHGDRA